MGELRIHNLSVFIETFGLNTFVETGTGKGDGIKYALKFPFEKLFSIEIIPELYKECTDTILDPRLSLYNLTSVEGLETILQQLKSTDRVLFWLDAHFPGADYHFNSYDHLSDKKELHKPLEKEIELIHNYRSKCKDAFIIDDLRIYENGPFELGEWELKDKYGEPGIGFIESKFENSHYIGRDYRHQGFIILTPIECY